MIDTGLDYTRGAFGPCSVPGTPAAPGGTCRVRDGFDTAGDDGSLDDDGHGTNVAGIVAGVAPGAHLIGIDAFTGSSAWAHDVIEGLDWVLANRAAHNIRAVNLSLGTSRSYHTGGCSTVFLGRSAYLQPFMLLVQAGVVPVVAAGNDAAANGGFTDGISSPACVGAALSVGAVYDANQGSRGWADCTDATTSADLVTCFSQDGPNLDLLAPGARIAAAGEAMDGTSQAAPHVAGAAAVLAAARPSATAPDIHSYLTSSATTVTDPRSGRTHPRLDLTGAMRSAFPVPNDHRASATPISKWGGHLGQTTWTATREPGEPVHAGNPGGASVWFTWTADRTGTAVFTTAGSDYDTLLAVYRTNGSGLTAAGSSDDTAAAPTSLVQVPVQTGDQLLIAVDGKLLPGSTFARSGRLRLTWNVPHDNVADATTLTPGTTYGTNIGATREFGEPSHGDAFSTASVWHVWRPSTSGTATISVDGDFSLLAKVYAGGPTVATLSGITQGNNGPHEPPVVTLTFPYSANTTYFLAIDGESYETACNDYTGQCWYATRTGTYAASLAG